MALVLAIGSIVPITPRLLGDVLTGRRAEAPSRPQTVVLKTA
jgi:hypothetical protein